MVRAYLLLMFGWLAIGAAVGIEDEYERIAASIWCQPGEQLVHIWNEDIYGRPVKQSMRACRRSRAADAIFYDDEDGIVRRQK